MAQKLDYMDCLVLRRVQEAMATIAETRVEVWGIGEGRVEFYINSRKVHARFRYYGCPNRTADWLELDIGPSYIHYRVTFGEQGVCYLSKSQDPRPPGPSELESILWHIRNPRGVTRL